MKYIFFSLRDFEFDVGESVRMYGLLNSLASLGHEVVFISNARKYHMFHPSIKHVFINYRFQEKRNLQGLLSLFNYRVVSFKYKTLFDNIKTALDSVPVEENPVYFFDYLDNSIGYVLKQKGWIKKYVNDVHGIATIEFQNHIINAKSFWSKAINKIKYHLAYKLDKKVFESADGFIFGSSKMKNYYEGLYKLKAQHFRIIPYLLSEDAVNRKVEPDLKAALQAKFQIDDTSFVVLFVGTYKPTAGVEDLINAFDLLWKEDPDGKLILIGNGPSKSSCLELAKNLPSKSNIYFIDNIPYSQLLTYQDLSKVIVCPDKNNLYSQYVVHVKYFDALISGKIVINGAFDSVTEINKDEFLSLTFRPSDFHDLYEKLKLCREGFEFMMEKYRGTRDFAAENLTYRSYVRDFLFS